MKKNGVDTRKKAEYILLGAYWVVTQNLNVANFS